MVLDRIAVRVAGGWMDSDERNFIDELAAKVLIGNEMFLYYVMSKKGVYYQASRVY